MAQDDTQKNVYNHIHTHTHIHVKSGCNAKLPVPAVPTQKGVPGFSEWLIAYRRDNRIGDLAADVRSNPPTGAWGYRDLKHHLRLSCACNEAMQALEAAKRAYYRHASNLLR